MRILLVSPKSSVWNSRKHIHMGLGYLAGALLAPGLRDARASLNRMKCSGCSTPHL